MKAKTSHRQRGAMVVTTALFFIGLIGFAALAVDVGHLLITRNELQNAADAAALAGANCLNRQPHPGNPGSNCISTPLQTGPLSWSAAQGKAYASIGLAKGDGAVLTDGTVTVGYKNVADSILSPTALMPTSLSPVTCNLATSGAPCYKPAVMVNISKSPGQNNGPVKLLISSMYGGAVVPISVKAVAVISAPGSVLPGKLIPSVINKCMFDLYWDSSANAPRLATLPTLNGVAQTIGQPWEIRIGSSYHYPNCDSGQWTSFDMDANSQSAIANLIITGNPTPLAIGDSTWIEPGTKTASYYDLDAQYPTPPGADVSVIVVDMPNGLNTKGQTPIVAFAGFHIDDIQGGSDKYIQGHFVQSTITGGSSGVGPFYGTYTPPRLAQ